MKRSSQGESPNKWKRIIGPIDDSDSSSSSSSSSSLDDLYGQNLCNFNRCRTCNRFRFMCKCYRQIITAEIRDCDEILPQDVTLTGEHANIGENEPGPSGINQGVHESTVNNEDDPVSIAIRASSSIRSYPHSRVLVNYLSKHHYDLGRSTNSLVDIVHNPRRLSAGNNERYLSSSFIESAGNEAGKHTAETMPKISAKNDSRNQPDNFNQGQEINSNPELDAMHSRLISLLECPVCLEPIVPPIHQCRRGHLICFRCKSQLNQCPTCRDKMSEVRNWVAERFAEQLNYPCKHASAGCTAKMLLESKTEHESSCSFRTFACPFRICTWSGFYPDLLPHLRDRHASRFLEGNQHQIDVELNSPTLFLTDWAISCLGEIFRFNVFQNIPNSMLYASGYYLGVQDKASSFVYTVSIAGPENRRITYSRQTHSRSTKMSSLCASGDCFLIKGDAFKHFVVDGNLRLKVVLERRTDSIV